MTFCPHPSLFSFSSAQCISSSSLLLFPSLAHWEYHGSSDPSWGLMEGGRQCQKEKTMPQPLFWAIEKSSITFTLPISMGTQFRILMFKALLNAPSKGVMPMQYYSYHQTAFAVLFQHQFPKKIAQMCLSLSAFLFNNINTYLLSIKRQPMLTAEGVQPIYCQ